MRGLTNFDVGCTRSYMWNTLSVERHVLLSDVLHWPACTEVLGQVVLQGLSLQELVGWHDVFSPAASGASIAATAAGRARVRPQLPVELDAPLPSLRDFIC